MTSDTKEWVEPKVVPTDSDNYGNLVAHIVKKEDQMRGYVMGEEITALCGYKWIPGRDFEGKPICQACKDELAKRRS